MRESIQFFLKSIMATFALPLLGAMIISGYSLMFTPTQSMNHLQFNFLYYFTLYALFSIPTALNNSISYSISTSLRLHRSWQFIIISGICLASFYSLLVIDLNFWLSIKQLGIYGFLLGGGSGAIFFWFFLTKKTKKSLTQHPHYLLHLSFLSMMFIACKLKLANYYPPSEIAVFLAVRPGLGFSSYINQSPSDSQFVLLRDENSYIGDRYFDFIFSWGWWLLPTVLIAILIFKQIKRKSKK